MCRTLQKNGYESKVILLQNSENKSQDDILRVTRTELDSTNWWRSLNLDGIIMFGWGRHRDTSIVRAIAASNTPLVIHVDGSGVSFPIFEHRAALKTLWSAECGTGRSLPARAVAFSKAALTSSLKILLRHTYLHCRHLRYATVTTFQTPTSIGRTLRLARLFGEERNLNLELVGYPVPECYQWDPAVAKEKRIIAIGRWAALRQKRPNILMNVCQQIISLEPDLHIDIFGTRTQELSQWHAGLKAADQSRIHLHGEQPAEILQRAMLRAQISFFPSSHEGGPQALFEGLACGVTTVGLDTPNLPGTRWAHECGHAELATRDNIEEYVAALQRALRKWEAGEYCPEAISGLWKNRTNAAAILHKMMAATAKKTEAKNKSQRG